MLDLVVVGGGIVGLAVARRFLLAHPGAAVTLLEKDSALGLHQTSRNSGVVHAGIYYKPGSLKARLSQRGVAMLRDYCAERSLPYVECGKLVVAVRDSEVPALSELERRATANGVPGLEWIGPEGIRGREPAVTGRAGLWSPRTAITDFRRVASAYAEDIESSGGELLTSEPASAIRDRPLAVEIETTLRRLKARRVVVCAGLYADRLAASAGDDPDPRIIPFRGEYYRLIRPEMIRGLVYPVPDSRYPFLGVHFTKTTDGTVLVGPNAVLALSREGYRYRDIDYEHVLGILRWRGFWALAARNWRAGIREGWQSINKAAYVRSARRYVADLGPQDLVRAPSGVRAQAVDRGGRLVDDFLITTRGQITFVRNAPSPAATTSLAIAEEIVDRLGT